MRNHSTLYFPRVVALVVICMSAIPTFASGDLNSRMTPLVRAVAEARPSVVNIKGRKTVRERTGNFDVIDKQVNGMGTGVVIDERGYIITNYHVIEGVSPIQVTLDDETSTTAKLIAHDPKTDLAIIKINTRDPLPVIKIGDSRTLMPAETVAAVGNAFGYEHTVTRGIVSELKRTVQVSDDQVYYDLIQTDASINPGNSGGPLLNLDGEMIGINVAVRVGAQGIGFAIPVNEALEVAADLMNEYVVAEHYFGLHTRTDLQDEGVSRVVVTCVDEDSPASRAGLEVGDHIEEIDGSEITRSLDVSRALLDRKSGEDINIAYKRSGTSSDAVVKVDATDSNTDDLRSLCWERLGLRLQTVAPAQFNRLNTTYEGGMRVVAVRPNSPAAQYGIHVDDILVGMHIWQTISYENVAYILSRPELIGQKAFRFYVLRGSETLWGNMRVAMR